MTIGSILGRTTPKVCPGRLFVIETGNQDDDKLSFQLGEFIIAIKYMEIESDIVERTRKRLTKRAEKEQRRRRRWKGGGSPHSTTAAGEKAATTAGKLFELGREGEVMEQRDNVNERGTMEDVREEVMMEVPKLAYLEITHTSTHDIRELSSSVNTPPADNGMATTKTVWSSSPGINFVGASSLSAIDIQSIDDSDDSHGNIGNNSTTLLVEQFNRIYSIQTIDSIRRGRSRQGKNGENNTDENVVTIYGQLGHEISPLGELLPSKWNNVRYTLEFSLAEGCSRGLQFTLRVEGGGVCDGGGVVGLKKNGMPHIDDRSGEGGRGTGTVMEMDYTVNSAHLFLRSEEEDEAYFGLGARMSRPNLRGLEVHVCHPTTSSSFSGHSGSRSGGRGGGRNRYSTKSTNSSSTMPHFITSSGTSLHLQNTEPSIFDFTHCGNRPSSDISWYSIRVPCSVMAGMFLVGTSPLHACELHTSVVGRAPILPRWAQERGVIVGLTG